MPNAADYTAPDRTSQSPLHRRDARCQSNKKSTMDNFKQNIDFLSSRDEEKGFAYSQDEFPSDRELAEFNFWEISTNVWKIKIESPANVVFFTMITLLNALILFLYFSLEFEAAGRTIFLIFLVAVSLLSVFLTLLRSTSSFYILDRNKKALSYSFESILFSRNNQIAFFDKISFATAGGYTRKDFMDRHIVKLAQEIDDTKKAFLRPLGIWQQSMGFYNPFKPKAVENENQWQYAPFLILNNGFILQMADFNNLSPILVNHQAAILAKIVDCKFIAAPPNARLSVKFDEYGGAFKVQHEIDESVQSKRDSK